MKQLNLIEETEVKYIPSPAELTRRSKVFFGVVPKNPATGKKFSKVEVSRILMKHWQEYLNPAIKADKDKMFYYLREQYYTDIKLDAQARRINHIKLLIDE